MNKTTHITQCRSRTQSIEATALSSKEVFKAVFDKYVTEHITEEQVQRVLAPVIAMIKAGLFDVPKSKRLLSSWYVFITPRIAVRRNR